MSYNPNAGSGASIGSTVTGGTTGSVLLVGSASALAQDNTQLFWDDTNNRLAVGTSTPSENFQVHNGSLALSNPAVAHGMTGFATTDVIFKMINNNGSSGGTFLQTFSVGNSVPFYIRGNIGVGGGNPCILFDGAQKSGTSVTSLGSTDVLTSWRNNGTVKINFTADGAGLFGNGSVSNPSISFNNDTDTGLYQDGANVLAFVSGGVQTMELDSASVAGASRMFLLDVDSGTFKRVSFGASDSGGTGFKLLRIAN